MKRRKTSYHAPYHQQLVGQILEVGQFGLEGEVERLKCDKRILIAELVKIRQEQLSSGAHLKAMEDRLQVTEQKQQMMTFLARAIRSPNFLLQLLQQKERRRELEEAISRKSIKLIEKGSDPADTGSSTLDTPQAPTKSNVQSSHDMYGFDVPEFESLVLEIQDFRRVCEGDRQQREQEGRTGGDLNEEFWEELLNESKGDKGSFSDVHGDGDDDDEKDVSLLVCKMGYLSPASPK